MSGESRTLAAGSRFVTAPVCGQRVLYASLVLLVGFALYANLARVALGSRYVLLVADSLLMVLVLYTASLRLLAGQLPTAVEAAVLALLGLGAAAIMHPNIPDFRTGIEGFRQTLYQMSAVSVGVALLGTRRRMMHFLSIVAVLAVPILLWAVKQFIAISALDLAIIGANTADIYTWQIFGKVRAFGFFSGPFHMGLFAGFVFWIGAALYFESRRRIWLVLAALSFLAGLATLTRGSLIAMCGSVPVVLFFVFPRARLRVAAATAVVLAGIGLGLYLLSSHVDAVGSVVESVLTLSELSDDSRLVGRFDGYREGIAAVATHPFGIGMGSAADALGHYFDPYKYVHITSHNMFLRMALETGWMGLGLFMAILWLALRAARRTARMGDHPMAMLLMGWPAIVLITGITGSSINAFPVNLLFWLIVGGAVRLTAHSGPGATT